MKIPVILSSLLAIGATSAHNDAHYEGVDFRTEINCSDAMFSSKSNNHQWQMRIDFLIDQGRGTAVPGSVSIDGHTRSLDFKWSYSDPARAAAWHFLSEPISTSGPVMTYMPPCTGGGGSCGVTEAAINRDNC